MDGPTLVYLTTLLLASLITSSQSQVAGHQETVKFVLEEQYGGEDGWSEWSGSISCTRQCGGGVTFQERRCLASRPDGSPVCVGPSKAYRSCNTQACPEGTPEFRWEQCQRYNSVAFEGNYYEWEPYYGVDNKCELNCIPKGQSFIYRHAPKVVDGTPCDRGSSDVCVDGVCQPVGCDGKLGSTARLDRCQQCGGDGTTCTTARGIIDTDEFDIGYHDILSLPAGATSITIEEQSASDNYLAIRDASGHHLLNADYTIDPPHPRDIAGTTFHYHRRKHPVEGPEKLTAKGPTTEAIYIMVLRQADQDSAAIAYEYSIPKTTPDTDSDNPYGWNAEPWGYCSQTCGGGIQIRRVQCMRIADSLVIRDDLCDPLARPAVNQSCNSQQPCPAAWHTGKWDRCSTTCGKGFQVRSVTCKRQELNGMYTVIDDSHCTDPQPVNLQSCNEDMECPKWETGEWSHCNRVCGPGEQTRQVYCRAQQRLPSTRSDILPDQRCHLQDKPSSRQECDQGPCEGLEWVMSEWSGCQGSCGIGVETRQVVCSSIDGRVFADEMCDVRRKPKETQPCSSDFRCVNQPQWHASQWSECSARCGSGLQFRQVICVRTEDSQLVRVDDSECDPRIKMTSRQECHGKQCAGIWFSGPWGKCSQACGGGQKQRQVMCFSEGEAVDSGECDPNDRPDTLTDCNQESCDEDNLLPVDGCKNTPHGCCPDGITPAEGANFLGCPPKDPIPAGLCIEADFGCCLDGITPALGPFLYGCPEYTCRDTRFGCCEDGQTPAAGPRGEGCPRVYGCEALAFGCCPDRITPANGFNMEGCEDAVAPPVDCRRSEFGCCPDRVTAAQGPDGYGCVDESSGETCEDTEYGCCDDGITAARGPYQEGCNEILSGCLASPHGCCPDGVTPAKGPRGVGCEDVEPPRAGCAFSRYGCCPDGETESPGPDQAGCPEPGCEYTIYGCCPDGEMAALGPDNAGCSQVDDCSYTEYGCCLDRVTPARGPRYEGCPEECRYRPYGCCPDGVGLATGPNYEGCEDVVVEPGCETSVYGCCLDNVTPARGQRYEGCPEECRYRPYGCCPDGVGLATGPNYEGCEDVAEPGCETSEYGCCLDNVTPARGQRYEGCPEECRYRPYGCCPDGVGLATGPNYEGCQDVIVEPGCEASEFGCCPDGEQPARGADFAGCVSIDPECDITEYGCCPDGYNIAAGNNFEGCGEEGSYVSPCEGSAFGCCPDGTTVAEGPNHAGCPDLVSRGANCALPSETGPGRNFSVKWYFDPLVGDCSRFWYGGQDGNENRFDSQEECKATCVKPEGIAVCYLPKATGRCKANEEKFYYNHEEQQCETFLFGGCFGNGNKFDSQEECQSLCVETQKADTCSQPSLTGPCRGRFQRWFFDRQAGECRQFTYGGCKGNDNRFETQELCEQRCHLPATEVCRLPSDQGACKGDFTRWYFNHEELACQQFSYGGCRGNVNRFSSQEDCEQTCHELLKKPVDICTLPQETGPCKMHLERWFYDRSDGFCKRFVFGGCDGNDNRFETEVECREACNANPPVDICTLPREPGSCEGSEERYYFDQSEGRCKLFAYGGCSGNENNFQSREECHKYCPEREAPTKTHRCLEIKDSGPCLSYLPRWYYDNEADACAEFIYGGCQGNRNRFQTEAECNRECKQATTTTTSTTTTTEESEQEDSKKPKDTCSLPKSPGPCYTYSYAWFYDPAKSKCEVFIYGGCEGNDNRFSSPEECEDFCTGSTDPTETVVTGLAVCSLPSEPGNCRAFEKKWYYDTEYGSCREFQFGGCDGNENRFDTEADCLAACPLTDICQLGHEHGPCEASKERYFFDSSVDMCRPFVYGGCDGNANRFLSLENCEAACSQPAPETEKPPTKSIDACYLPAETGRCRAHMPSWYYNAATASCAEFVYGGCDGNDNRFGTREECEAFCAGVVATPSPATLPSTGVSASTTRSILTTLLSLTTKTVTPVVPTDVVTVDVCSMERDSGPCTDFKPVWYFEPVSRTCRRFRYGGCEGNGNRFDSRDECWATCLDTTSTVTQGIVIPTKSPTPSIETSTPSIPTEAVEFDRCTEVPDPGPCSDQQIMWFYEPDSAACKEFAYGGCDGNANRFESQDDCHKMCVDRRRAGVCSQPVLPGPCFGNFMRWFFDPTLGTCREFLFGGCNGNENKFESEDACLNFCQGSRNIARTSQKDSLVTKSTVFDKDVEGNVIIPSETPMLSEPCELPYSRGPCKASILRWYYDPVDNMCKDFVYGGCRGNTNNFASKAKCQEVCRMEYVEDICALPRDPGPCEASILSFFFNSETERCEEFFFGGCQGNENRFRSRNECHKHCGGKEEAKVTETPLDVCKQPKQAGPCFADYLRYYFDEESQECRPFVFGGCQGNKNNFNTQDECYQQCGQQSLKPNRIFKPGDCYEAPDAGPCKAAEPRWYFDANRGDCLPFYYGGCDGNGNNFRSHDDCTALCSRVSVTCGVLQCNLQCEYGFTRGLDGCLQCQCFDPCQELTCPATMECTVEQIVCITEPCPGPRAMCKPKPKPGKCPDLDPRLTPICQEQCKEDNDCPYVLKCCSNGCGTTCALPRAPADPDAKPGICPAEETLTEEQKAACVEMCVNDTECPDDGKCCSNGCGHICMPPLPAPGCVLSKFGCCPDGIAPAGGYNFRGCPEEAPEILGLSQEEVAVIIEDSIVLKCRVKGSPLPQISWYRENEPLLKVKEDDDRLVEHPDGSLQINQAGRQDSVRYTCRAFNGVGEPATKTFILRVHEPVYFKANLTNSFTAIRGAKVTLPCGAHGVPPPRVEWLRDDAPVQYDGLRVTLGEDDSLNIEDLTSDDVGDYVCQASNGVKEPKRRTVHLHVQGPLAVEMGEHAGLYEVGDDVRLMCHVFGGGDITVTWSKNNKPLKPSKRFMETAQGELLIEGLIRHDRGNYTCTVTRGEDQASVQTQIKVEGVEIPDDCLDMPSFANCRLIVKGRYCRHEYFSKFCCRSCHEAGLLP